MSQVSTAAPVRGPSSPPVSIIPNHRRPPVTVSEVVTRAAEGVRAGFAGTPGRLRLVALGVILGCLITGFGGFWALNQRSSALSDARDTTAHLVQLQQVQTSLLQAEASITNTFLLGGLEDPVQLAGYYSSMDQATSGLTLAARASQADARALAGANLALARDTGLVEAARANNRAGQPVGVSYLTAATKSLADDVIAPVAARVTADTKSIDGSLNRAQNARWWLLGVAVLGLGLLIGSQYALAQTTRRIINPPAAAATVALLVVLVIAAGVMAAVQNMASDTRTGAYADTVQLATSRVAAFDAKSIESLGLIQLGSGADTNQDWLDEMKTAGQLPRIAGSAASSLEQYSAIHVQIRKLDDAGETEDARTLATRPATDAKSANAAFTSYANQTKAALDTSAKAASDGLHGGWLLTLLAILLALVGVGAAIVGWFGVSLRMGEYR